MIFFLVLSSVSRVVVAAKVKGSSRLAVAVAAEQPRSLLRIMALAEWSWI